MMDINPRNGDFCVLFKSHSKKNIFVEIKTTHFQIIQSSDTHRFYKAYSSQKSMIYKHRVSMFSGKQKQTTDNKLKLGKSVHGARSFRQLQKQSDITM